MSEPDDAGAIWELVALQNLVNESRSERIKAMEFWNGGPLPKPTRVQRFRRRWSRRIWNMRQRVALKLAPWLDE